MYWWRLILKEYGPEIVYVKGLVHNTIADAISMLEDISPDTPPKDTAVHQNWMTFSKCWCEYKQSHNDSTDKHSYSMNQVFANRSKEEETYPLIVKEMDAAEKTLIENASVFCKNGKFIIPRSLQQMP